MSTATVVVIGCYYRCRICGMGLMEETHIPRPASESPECRGCGSWMKFQSSGRIKPEHVGKGIVWCPPSAAFVTPQMALEREIWHEHFRGRHARCAEIFNSSVSCQRPKENR